VNIKNFLIVFAGSGFGGALRYAVQYWMGTKAIGNFPAGTFMVNIIGCFCIGFVYSLAGKVQWLSPEWRLAAATGFCGGFTTFSAFAMENVTLLRNGSYGAFLIYIALSILLGIAAVYAGIYILKTS
jgi:fluoride exporter